MKLLTLTIQNFKGIKTLVLNPQGKNVSAFADNGLCKTTIFDAYQWLLNDKDSLGRADFEIKPHGTNGQGIHSEVEGVFQRGNTWLTFKKSYHEVHTKKRGSAIKEFTGHTTDFYIDGVPVKQKDYLEKIRSIADEKTFRLMTDPRYFNEQLHWTDRRSILLEMCGDVSDEDVIASDPKFSEIPSIIENHPIEDYIKIAHGRRKAINDELTSIPVRIDEATKSKAKPEKSMATAKTLIKGNEKNLTDKERELNRVLNNTEKTVLERELNALDATILDAENGFNQLVIDQKNELQQAMLKTKDAMNEALRSQNEILMQIASIEKSIAMDKAGLQPLRDKWIEINSETYIPLEVEDICPSCGQKIPQVQIEEAQRKYLENLNKKKSERLEEIDKKGRAIKEGIAPQEKQVKDLQAQANAMQEGIDKLTQAYELAKSMVDDYERPEPPQEIADLKAQKEQINAQIRSLEEDSAPKVEELSQKIQDLKDRIAALNQDITQHTHNKKMDDRVSELKETEKSLAGEFEELERHLFLLDEFTRSKCLMLDERINSRFQTCRYKLFNEQINGGLAPTCELVIDWVPYWSINNAARIQAGVEFISVAQEHYGIKMPLWIDNRESVTTLPEIDCQIISLYVAQLITDEWRKWNDEKVKILAGIENDDFANDLLDKWLAENQEPEKFSKELKISYE